MNITDENFEAQVSGSEKPVVADFFAEWCEPCKVLGPILEKVAEENKEKFVLIKANLDDIPQTAQKFKIERIPTVILFSKGKPVAGFVGLMQEREVKQWLDEALKKL